MRIPLLPALALPAHAATITLSTVPCTFGVMTVTPAGDFNVQCSAVTPTPIPTPPPIPPPPPLPPGTCPPTPPGMVTGNLGLQGATQRPQLQSGQVISFPLPSPLPASSPTLGIVRAGETTATPAKSYFEIMISKCPGQIQI